MGIHKQILIFFLFLLSGFLIGQTEMKSTSISLSKIPAEIKYDGKVVNAVEWIDKNGKNIVVVTETGIIESKSGDDNKSASLFAAHYIFSKNSYALTWKITDFVKLLLTSYP